jgi:hypothetical protein
MMVQRVSKLDASRILEVSPSTIDRRIERGELQVEHEARGNSYKVWVLLDDAADDLAGDGASAEAIDRALTPAGDLAENCVAPLGDSALLVELTTLRERAKNFEELSEFYKTQLDGANYRYHEVLQNLTTAQQTVDRLTKALNPGSDAAVPTKSRWYWWPFGRRTSTETP